MILFVFEGEKVEPLVFDSLHRLFLAEEKVCVVKYGRDLLDLHKRLEECGEDLIRVLHEQKYINVADGERLDTMFSQVFLFFDYDFQNKLGTDRVNDILKEMLSFFSNETENGKLYINYPMTESLKYTKEMPDRNYWQYTVSRQTCVKHKFKGEAELFAYSAARGFRFIDIKKIGEETARANWELLKLQNVSKANYVVSGQNTIPATKEEIAQPTIFAAQLDKYVLPNDCIAILNAFPVFLYEYLK